MSVLAAPGVPALAGKLMTTVVELPAEIVPRLRGKAVVAAAEPRVAVVNSTLLAAPLPELLMVTDAV